MHLGRFRLEEKIFYGSVEGDTVVEIRDIFSGPVPTGNAYPLNSVRVLAPCLPTKAVCVGLNYVDHAREFGLEAPEEPVLFIKPPSTVIGPGDNIEYPEMSRRVDYEAELAVVISKKCRNIDSRQAFDYILGYTCANDVTARDLQKKDAQWTRAKSFDTFLPLGPYIITDADPGNLNIFLFLNGVCKQKSSTGNLIFSVPELLGFISRVMTLYPGDVILTGTPSGVGPVAPGDEVVVEIKEIGRLHNRIK